MRCERPGGERGLEAGDRLAGVLDGVALRLHPLPECRARGVGAPRPCWPSTLSCGWPADRAVGRDRAMAPRRGRAPRSEPRRSLPVGREHAHRELVPPAAVAPDRLPRPALDDEPDAPVGPDRALVELEHA